MLRKGKRATPTTKASSRVEPDKEKLVDLFSKYKDSAGDGIGPEGVEELCGDLGVDPADRKVLLLAWKMGAQRMGFFSREEFERGFRSMRATTLAQVKKALGVVEQELSDPDIFLEFHEFAFKYCLTEPRQKIIDIETAVQMLGVVMPENPHLGAFTEFLEEQTEYKFMNLDQWTGFGRFTQEVDPDCTGYDENQAWPLLLDNYVEWVEKRKGS